MADDKKRITTSEWFDNFLSAFGEFATQQEFVQSLGDTNQDGTSKNPLPQEEVHKEVSKNDKGNKQPFEVVVQRKKKKDNRADRGLTIQFTSGQNKQKSISASIEDFCGGRYLPISKESVENIAKTVYADSDFVFNYIDASMMKYANDPAPEDAMDLVHNLNITTRISRIDYNKLTSKLNSENIKLFNNYLTASDIQVEEDHYQDKITYCVAYLRDLKEYKLVEQHINIKSNIHNLQQRAISVLIPLNKKYGSDIVSAFSKEAQTDSILRQLNLEDINV